MATRNMKVANQSIFSKLDEYCAIRQDPIQNAGKVRYIATSAEDKDFLQKAKLLKCLSITPTMKLAKFAYDNRDYFVTAGLHFDPLMPQFEDQPLSAGILTAFLHESALSPIASAPTIRNVVEAGNTGADGYAGHHAPEVASLYREIRVHTLEETPSEDTDRLMLYLCLHDEERANQWMSDALVTALKNLATSAVKTIPYRTLSRSLFDIDPGALYLALYRCLEALYAYTHAHALKGSLAITRPWTDIARELEEKLSWWPHEDTSLKKLLQLADAPILQSLLEAFKQGAPAEGDSPASMASQRIYKLRNSLVHYRPAHQNAKLEETDWNAVCASMVDVVLSVYPQVYGTMPAPAEGATS